jgi:hypothetical protein
MNWKVLRKTLAIALIALIASACCSSRQTAVSEFQGSKVLCEQSEQARAQEFKDSVKVEKVVVEVHDTVMETTTIVVDRNEAGDTVRLSTVTERDRVRDRAQVKDQHERVVTKHDTVYVATRDSSYVQTTNRTNETNGRATPVVLTLKWVFWIIIAIIALIVTIKLSRILEFKN